MAADEVLAYPIARTCPFAPPAGHAELREQQPAALVQLPGGERAWLVTRYDDVRRLATDPRVSSDRTHPALPLTEPVTPAGRAAIAAVGRSLIGLDGAEHNARRRTLIPEFTLRRMHALRPRVQEITDQHVTAMLAGPRPADLVTAVALPVTAMVICELLGVPYADRSFFQERAAVQVRRGVEPAQRRQAGAELRGYLDELVTAKEADPPDDLLGRLAGAVDHDTLVGLAMLLLLAGFESTASMIALGVADLLEHPDQLAALRADPGRTPAVVEELLRHLAIVDTMPRVATAEVTVAGTTIPAGAGLLLGFAAANHDPAAFGDAAALDVGRGARHHVAFGYGVHQCLGQNLARLELDVVLRTLFARVPGLRLAEPAGQLPFRTDASVYGVDRLPVTWEER
ncbi:cytochrome P450 [Actinoplanes sp. N902-109]|uniref:cytochrome P450 n=1 Tax=Actinoplanes sp. (strain N902-109) TaxID=649831 RepID=UPI000329687B|nr:cytochrome P450 [Actinoplanes sp. N902-109]AGL16732.1 epothilone b hydroxylase [Actinoplanes sp. N902-109]